MDLNFGAIDVLYDSDFLIELEEKFLQYRARSSRAKSRQLDILSTNCRAEEINVIDSLSPSRASINRSPATDYEVCNFVFSFLKTQYFASTSRSTSGEGVLGKKSPSLERVLESRRKAGKFKNQIPLQHQTELALLWRTINIFLGADDISPAIDFFREFLSTMDAFPALSLSTYWTRVRQACLVDIPRQPTVNTKIPTSKKSKSADEDDHSGACDKGEEGQEIPLLSLPELAYLNINDEDRRDGPRMDNVDNPNNDMLSSTHGPHDLAAVTANLSDHDPLGVIQKLFDVTECLALAIPPSDRHVLLSVGLTLGVKAGRAALLLGAASVLASSESVLNDTDIDINILNDMKAFVVDLQKKKNVLKTVKSEESSRSNKIKTDKSCEKADAGGQTESHRHSSDNEAYNLLKESILSSKFSSGGLVMSFGKADHGKLGHGDSQVHRAIPTVVESMKHCSVVKIASMSTYCVVVDNEGGVFVWGTGGSSGNMQGLRTDIIPQPLEALVEKAPIISVACGLGHALFLLANGKVCSWGNGGNGRLGLGDTTDRAEACLIKDLLGEIITSVQCGASHSMAITKKNGNVYMWGKNSQGQCGKGNLEDVSRPSFNGTLQAETVVKMAAGWEHTIALTAKGALYAWGSGYKDSRRGLVPPVLGLGHAEGRSLPELVSSMEGVRIIDIASGWDHCLALDSKRRVYSWGSGQNGKLGHGSEENITSPLIIPTLENVHVVQISAGCEHSGAISASGELYTWGHGDGGRLGHGDSEPKSIPTKVEALLQMHARPLTLHCGDKFTMIAVEPLPASMAAGGQARISQSSLAGLGTEDDDRDDKDSVFSLSWLHGVIDEHILSLDSVNNIPGEKLISSRSLTLRELELLIKKSSEVAKDDKNVESDHESGSLKVSGQLKGLPTGRDILLGVMSLMARSFNDDVFHDNKLLAAESAENNKKPCLAYEYSVEISVQLFQSLLVILTLQSEELFENDDVDGLQGEADLLESQQRRNEQEEGVENERQKVPCLRVDEDWVESGLFASSETIDRGSDDLPVLAVKLPKSLLTWATMRCALSVLRSNLNVLNDVCATDNKKDLAIKGLLSRHLNKAESKLFDMNSNLNEFSSSDDMPKGSLSASGRLASLLGASLTSNMDDFDGLRSSDDDDDDDDDEDDEDDDDDDDEDDDEDEEDDEDERGSEDEEDDEDGDDEDDCEEDEDMRMGDMLDHINGDEGYDDDDMDISKDLLDDEEAARLARAVIRRAMEGEGSEQEHNESQEDQEDHDHSYDDEYDLGKDLYDNEDEMNLNVDEEDGGVSGRRGHGQQQQHNYEEDSQDLDQSSPGVRERHRRESGGGNNDCEDTNDNMQVSEQKQSAHEYNHGDGGPKQSGQQHKEIATNSGQSRQNDENDVGKETDLGQQLSPSASQESLDLSGHVAKSNHTEDSQPKGVGGSRITEDDKSNDGDQKDHLDDDVTDQSENAGSRSALYADDSYYDDEDDDEYQRAISASMEGQNNVDVLQLMLQSKQVFKTNEVLPLLGKQLEYISRLCFERIKSSRASSLESVQHDVPALVEMWKDLQSTISVGFQTLYSLEEQRELISYSVKKAEDWMHMSPSVSMALSKDEFLLTSLSSSQVGLKVTAPSGTSSAKKKGKNNNNSEDVVAVIDDKQSEHDLKHSIDIPHICLALKSLKKHDISTAALIRSVFDDVEIVLPSSRGEKQHESSTESDMQIIRHMFAKNLHYTLIHASLNTLRCFVSFFLLKFVTTTGPSVTVQTPQDTTDHQNMTELLETIVQVVNAEMQELAATIPKKVAHRYQSSKRCALRPEDCHMIHKILQNSITSKLLTCMGGFFVSNNTSIKNIALFMPYAVQLLHIYQQSHGAFGDSSSRFQHVCDIGEVLQRWLWTEMRWIVLFVSSAINVFFSVNEEKNLGRFKHTTEYSVSSFNNVSLPSLIDINVLMTSMQHNAWNNVDDVVKLWCSVFFSDVKAAYFPTSAIASQSLGHNPMDVETKVSEKWEVLLNNLSDHFFDCAKVSSLPELQPMSITNRMSTSKWFIDISSFFSLFSINWMTNFAPTFQDLVSLTSLEASCVALIITFCTEDDSVNEAQSNIPLVTRMKQVGRENAQYSVDLISTTLGEDFIVFFKSWVKSLRIYLFALFCRYYDLHMVVDKMHILANSTDLNVHSSSFVEKMMDVWFLTFNVLGTCMQLVLRSISTTHVNSKQGAIMNRMTSILHKNIELMRSAVKSFELRAQDSVLLMSDASETEIARVAASSRWLVDTVMLKGGGPIFSVSDEASESTRFIALDQSFLQAAANGSNRPSGVLSLLENVAGLAVFLLGDMSVSTLEHISLINHICYRSTIYGVQLCTETFSLLRESEEALCYFSASLELPQLKTQSVRSVGLNYVTEDKKRSMLSTEWFGGPSHSDSQQQQTQQQQQPMGVPKLPHLKKQSQVICSLDNCITEIFASISKKIFSENTTLANPGNKPPTKATHAAITDTDSLDLQSVTLFPKLIDTLQFSIRSAIEDSSFRFNFLSLASPLFGMTTLMNMLQSICADDKAKKKDEMFWKMTKLLRQYLNSAHNLQMTISDLTDLPSAASSLLPPLSENASLVNTERGLDTLRSCHQVMKMVENITAGLGDMRLAITRQCVATDTKVYLPQIRLLDYSSPVIIPNTSTDFGNYSIGFWIKIPTGYNQVLTLDGNSPSSDAASTSAPPMMSPRSSLQANSEKKRSTHILSRVPEAGEVGMSNLFKGVPTSMCNPGIILEVLPDGTALLVVTITSTVDKDGKKTPSKKTIRMVKLSSKPLPLDMWVDVSLQFTCLFKEDNQQEAFDINDESAQERHRHPQKKSDERSIIHLFIDGDLHATAEDCFGRLSLHQNIIFGTIPVSLIKPINKNDCLQAGGLRWSAQTSHKVATSATTVDGQNSPPPTLHPLNNSYPAGEPAMISIQALRPSAPPLQIKMLYEPFVCVQNIQQDLSDTAQFSLNIASNFFMVHTKETLLRLHASLDSVSSSSSSSTDPQAAVTSTFNILTSKPHNNSAEKALGYLEALIALLPAIGYRAVCLLGDCSYCDSLQESIFHFLSVNIDVLVTVKAYVDKNARQLSSFGPKIRAALQVACSALQQQVSFLLSIVETLVKQDNVKTNEERAEVEVEAEVEAPFAAASRSSIPVQTTASTQASALGSSRSGDNMSSLLQYWLQRLHDSKHLLEEKIYPTDMISAWILAKGYNNQKQNENGLVTNIASIVAKAVNSDLINISKIISPLSESQNFGGAYNSTLGDFGSGLNVSMNRGERKTALHMLLVGFFAGGGWPVSIQSNSMVDLYPRALFLHQDPRALEHTVFPATALVRSAAPIGGISGVSSSRPNGVWLHHCDGVFGRQSFPALQHTWLPGGGGGVVGKEPRVHFLGGALSAGEQDDTTGVTNSKTRAWYLEHTSLIPRQKHLLIQSTEMVSARDAYVPLALPHVAHVMQLSPMGSASSLLALLQRLSRLSSRVFTSGAGNKATPRPVLPPKGILKVDATPLLSPQLNPSASDGGMSTQDPILSVPNIKSLGVNEPEHGEDNPALELTMCMSHIRSLLVQLATAECLQGHEKVQHLKLLQTVLERDLHPLISIALLDPVNSVVQAFHKAAADQQLGESDSPSTGQQLDVLSNLLREGDICFLEKISLRVWRHFHNGDSSGNSESKGARNGHLSSSFRPQPTPLSGEVQILGNRIRALSHFPSVKIYPVSLEKMSGRWFYECTLLSDGLMQIGWADRSFRSDPVCGQGVGDHLHSWAVDGLRTKKWNVSCEAYGTRWKVEDVIGVLVDMDLLEMKFFINGVDFGPAFTNFQAVGLYPAISLNVRQCLRVNYGQEMFMYPPDVVDKLPYRPVRDAVHWKSKKPPAPPPPKKSVDKTARTGVLMGENAPPDVTHVERVTIIQSESANPGHISARVGSAVPGRRASRGNIPDSSRGISTSTEDEAAARHAAMVVSAANTQTGGVTSSGSVGGGGATDALDESVDERQMREGTNVENAGETNTWAEMGQSLSRRGSRIGLSPRANSNAGSESAGISAAAQRLLHLAAAVDKDSSTNDVNDDDDDEGGAEGDVDEEKADDDDDEEEDSQAVMRFFLQQQRNERRVATLRGGANSEVEARRQRLIENLIAMGFPIDWSLRAAEHCDANVSESVAIAWIIERMELEHAKMEEMDGGEDSRMAEEQEESEDNHGDGEPSASSALGGMGSAQHRTNFGYHGGGHDESNLDDNEDSKENNATSTGTTSSSAGMLSKPTPKPPSGLRGLAGVSGTSQSSSKNNQLNHDFFTGSACSTGGYQEQGTWNNENLSYSTILVGHESARRRFDMDKQAVLSQISELDFCDLFPIVLSCQFSLCIFYARCAFIRIFRLICNTIREVPESSSSMASKTSDDDDTAVLQRVLGENYLSLLLDSRSDSPHGCTSMSSLVNLLEICFKQGQGAACQPDKLFPSLLKGTTAGDPIDTCPTLAPFTSHNSRSMTQTLSMLELAVFAYYEDSRLGYRAPKIISTIAMEESSLQSSLLVMSFLDVVTKRSRKLSAKVPPAGGTSDQMVATICSKRNINQLGMVGEATCSELLRTVIRTCFMAFDTAIDEAYDRKDWISSGSERSIQESSQKSDRIKINEDVSHKPYIFWAFTTLKSMLQTASRSELAGPLEHAAHVLRVLHTSATDTEGVLQDPIVELSSPEVLSRLIKIANSSVNSSLNYCIFSICNEQLNRVNRHISTVRALLQDPHAQFQLQVATDEDSHAGSLPIVPLLRQWEKKLMIEATGFYKALTTIVFPQSSKNNPFQNLINHPRGGFSTEYKILRICSTRLLTESAHYRLNSRYTRELFQLLLEANVLRGNVVSSTVNRSKDCGEDLRTSEVHEDIINDWRVAACVANNPTSVAHSATSTTTTTIDLTCKTVGLDNLTSSATASPTISPKEPKKVSTFMRSSSSTANSTPAAGKGTVPVSPLLPTLSIVHVTSTSLQVTWSNIPEDEDWNSAVQRAAVAASNSSSSSSTGSLSIGHNNNVNNNNSNNNSSNNSNNNSNNNSSNSASNNNNSSVNINGNGNGSSLSASVGGLLASIKGTLSYSQPNHTSFSLYITPIYRNSYNISDHGALSGPSVAESVLVMPFVIPRGSHKINMLDPDTLYRVSLVSDEEGSSGASFNGTPMDSPRKNSSSSNMSFTTWGTKLLRGGKKEANPVHLMSATGPAKFKVDEDSHPKMAKSTSNVGAEGTEETYKEGNTSCETTEKVEKGVAGAVDFNTKLVSTNPFENPIAVLASTSAEPLFLLDRTVGFCPPQLKISHHGLTVRNTVNKKWSTVRSTCRLTSGVHQWDIFIDRCISKNIFLGVVGPEARKDNYVGCDKHGWAFLANRAVWFDKGKLKSYGELFRTGDVVQVTLDLDSGGLLSFGINGKDLGVAVEGLSGPLYPAFSLYNEDDQISLSPPRQPLFVSVPPDDSESKADSVLAKMAYDANGLREGQKGNSSTANAERAVQRLDTVQYLLRFVAAGRNYRGVAKKSSSVPVFMPKQFLHSSIVTELALRWTLWRKNTTLRTVRVKSGEIVTILISSVLCLAISDNRYCPGDLIQWEQHQCVVLGVGSHRLWVQRTCGNGEVTGFTKESLHALHVKNSIRVVKKRSALHRVRVEKSKAASFTPCSLSNKIVHDLSVHSQDVQTTVGGVNQTSEKSDPTDETKCSPSCSSQLDCFSESDFENPTVLSIALIDEADNWTHDEDACLLEWLDLRARLLGTHPLNMSLDQLTSPVGVLEQLRTLGEETSGKIDGTMGNIAGKINSTSAVVEFSQRFKSLQSKSLLSLRLRALVLLHLNDTLSPLLSLVFDSNTVDDSAHTIKSTLDLMSPLNTMILAHRHLILLEVKFDLGFRLGWSTMMSQCMLEGGANNVTSMLQKRAAFVERKHQPFADDNQSVSSFPPSGNITFTSCPSTLPVLPFRVVSSRASSANKDLKVAGDSMALTVCALNALNNPLHPSNTTKTVGAKVNSKSDPQIQAGAIKSAHGYDNHLHGLSVYYFEDSASCFLNWSTCGQTVLAPSTPTASAGSFSLQAASTNSGNSSSGIIGLPSINMFVLEPHRLLRAVSEHSKKAQLQPIFERDYRWRMLFNIQSSLLGQFMQTMERMSVQQASSKLSSSSVASPETDSGTTPENLSFLSQVAPDGQWHRILRSVFRGGMFWDEHMLPSSRPVSLYVHFLPHSADMIKKESRASKKDRYTGTMDSARSAATLTPRQTASSTTSTTTPTVLQDGNSSSEMLSSTDKDRDVEKDKEREEILRSVSLLTPSGGHSAASAFKVAGRLQRVFSLLQTNATHLIEGAPLGSVSPWGQLQAFIVEAVAEVQPLLTSPLLASEQEIHTMDDNELNHLAKTDVLCHHLAQQAQFGDAGQEASCSLPGVVNLHLHVMHSLGVLLGVALRHGITPHIKMSSIFWQWMSKSHANPYVASGGEAHSDGGRSNSNAGRRAQDLFSGVRETCGRALRHGVVSVLPEQFLDLLQERELRALLSGGGTTDVENLRAVATYTKPVQASDLHIEMFWTALSDLPRYMVIRFLQSLWQAGGSAPNNHEDCERGLPEELYYWKCTSSTLGGVSFADLPAAGTKVSSLVAPGPKTASSPRSSTTSQHPQASHTDIQLIHMSTVDQVIYLPRYTSLDVMRSKLKFFVDNL